MARQRGRKVSRTALGVLTGWLGLALVVACSAPTGGGRVTAQSPTTSGRCGSAQTSDCGDLTRSVAASASRATSAASSLVLHPGSGTDVGVGANGAVWLVGANVVGGGFGIWHWTGSAWASVPGGAVRVAVDPSGNPWVINSLHAIYRWSGTGWIQLPGAGIDVGVGANGAVWLVGVNVVGGGFGIWNWTGSAWASVPGGAVRVAVDPSGNPWIVNSLHAIYRWSGAGWIQMPGGGTDVGVGANGSAWVVGVNAMAGGFGIWNWSGSAWQAGPGGAVAISVDPTGNPWLINSSAQIWSALPVTAGCGLAAPAFCDNFTNESPPGVSRSGPLSAVWGVSRVTNYQNPSQGNVDTWDGVSFGAENDTPMTSGACA